MIAGIHGLLVLAVALVTFKNLLTARAVKPAEA